MAEEPRECDCESVLRLLHEFADAVAAEGQCREIAALWWMLEAKKLWQTCCQTIPPLVIALAAAG